MAKKKTRKNAGAGGNSGVNAGAQANANAQVKTTSAPDSAEAQTQVTQKAQVSAEAESQVTQKAQVSAEADAAQTTAPQADTAQTQTQAYTPDTKNLTGGENVSQAKIPPASGKSPPQTKTTAATNTPLDGAEFSAVGFQIQEEKLLGKIIIRGKSDDAAFISAAKEALSADLPLTPNTVVTSGSDKILWLSPEEWLLWTADSNRQKSLERLEKGFAGLHAAAIDVSDYYTLIRMSGERAEEILSHGCPLDLRESAFASGICAQTRYRNAGILLYKVDATTYDIQIRWSFAEYLWNYFINVNKAETGETKTEVEWEAE